MRNPIRVGATWATACAMLISCEASNRRFPSVDGGEQSTSSADGGSGPRSPETMLPRPSTPGPLPGQTSDPVPPPVDASVSMIDGGLRDAGAGGDAGLPPEGMGGQSGDATDGGMGDDSGTGGQSSMCPEGGDVCEPSCSGCLIEGECIGAGVDNPDNPCQSCDPIANAADWTGHDGDPCDDGEFCTVNDECVTLCDGCLVDGQCIPDGQEASGNPCMVCDVSVANESYSAATGKTCGEGPVTCSAQDTCNAQGVCQANHTPSGTACGNASSSACDAADTCDGAGACQANQSSNGTPCDDGQYCTTSSECQGGSCVGTQNRSCATNQTCNEQTDACACTGCVIGANCVASGAVNPSNACQVCAPSVSTSSYSPNTGANCGSSPSACSGQDTCSAAGVCQANDSTNGSACTGGECQSGVCEPFTNPFDCVAPDPPVSVLPSDLFGLAGDPPANTGGTIANGTYTPVRIDFYDGAETIDLMTFEFSNGFVQLAFRYYTSGGVAFIPEVQFAGSFSTSGSTLSFDVERCDPQYDLDPPSLLYTVTANGMRIEQRTFNDERVVVTYQRN